MRNVYFLLCTLLTLTFCQLNSNAQGSCADGAYQWSDMATIFQNNGCAVATCHDASAASGLDLTTFAGFNTGGTKCETEIASGTTLVDIIQTGGVVCGNGTVANAMNGNIANPLPAADITAIQAWVDSGAFENCRGVPEDDGYPACGSSVGALDVGGQTNLCTDGSNPPTLGVPTGTLPDIEIAIEINGVLTTVSPDGSFDTSTLVAGDEVCYTTFNFDLAAIQALLETANGLCPTLDILFPDLLPCGPIGDLIAGNNDGVPGLNGLLEVLDFAASLSSPITSVQSATATINALNGTIEPLNLGPICYATSNNVCLIVEECTNTCPTVILNDNNLPTLPPAVCADDNLSLCFDVNVDEATFDPALVQFNYVLTIDGAPSTVTLSTSYVSGGGIDPTASGQLCFETLVPAGNDPCAPYDLSLEIIDVFYNDVDCPDNFIAYDLNITTPIALMQTGDNLNDLIPLLALAGLNPILVQIYPNPNWTASVTQAPACDGTTLGIIEILAADGITVCETLTDVGTAGMDGCPPTDAVLPETLYENYLTYTDADGMEQANPCAISITIAEQTAACEDQCIMCPTVVNVIPPDDICVDAVSQLTFCVEFDMAVDANTVLTVDGVSMDGSVGGTQICVDFTPYLPLIDPCSGSVIAFTATAICDGTDLLAGIAWLDTQILPFTDPACGGIVGCMDDTACNYNPNAVCDDPNAPCIPAPTCNTDPCVGDVEIVDPNDACQCIVDQPQVLGCTDNTACNYNAAANCDDGSCLPAPVCNTDPCAGDTEIVDPNDACTCIVDQVQVLGCTDSDANNYDPAANCDDGSCIVEMCTDPCAPNFGANEACEPYDMTCNTDCITGDIEVWDAAICSCIVDIPTVLGCTEATACNYDPNANCDNGSCLPAPVCNTDPCAGDTEIIDPNDACACILDQAQVLGCTDSGATNYDPAANCDDGNCMFEMCTDPCAPNFGEAEACDAYDFTCNTDCTLGDIEIWDATSCSCVVDIATVLGCTDNSATNYDPAANCDDGSCTFEMCIDPCAPNFGAAEACEAYDMTCNTDCTNGDLEVWDATSCSCVVDIATVLGCTDNSATNYDPAANCDDGSCTFEMCDDPCAPNFGAAEACDAYDTTCNSDCTTGDIEIWDAASCSCVVDIATVLGCTDSSAANYDPAANCDDGSCITVCEEEIVGSIVVPDPGCDVSGLEVVIMASDGTSITVTTDANGNFTVPGGPFECGTYSATITDANVPACFTDTGDIGPVQFVVDGAGGGDDGPFFFANPGVPTLSQWGLMILALLLMTFGALKLGFQYNTNEEFLF